MTDREMYEMYRRWILEQTDPAYEINEKSEDEIDFVTENAVGHVQFYHLEYEICALTIESDKADEPVFFLHFEIKDLDHAKDLFTQMTASLKKAGEDTKVKVLLSCTSGFTTSFFADKLNGAAETLGLEYEFSAVPYNELFEAAQDKDVILLAPQIGYLFKKAQEVLKDKVIIQIPANVFASYNVTQTVNLIKEELDKKEKVEETVEDIHDPEWDSSIAIVAIIRRNRRFEIHWRGADKEAAMERGVTVKDEINLRDLEDVLDVLFIRHPEIKGVAIVAPGIVYEGRLTLPTVKIFDVDVVGEFTKKYGRTFILCNDANAAAVGYYANHRDCGNLLAYYHPLGNVVGGAGLVINGNPVFGKKDFAGECANYLKTLNFSEDRYDLARTPEGIVELITKLVLPMVCTIGPDTLAVYCDLLTDPEELKESLKKYVPERHLPQIVKMDSRFWELFYGAGVLLYNVLHGSYSYREDLKEFRN